MGVSGFVAIIQNTQLIYRPLLYVACLDSNERADDFARVIFDFTARRANADTAIAANNVTDTRTDATARRVAPAANAQRVVHVHGRAPCSASAATRTLGYRKRRKHDSFS